MSASATPLTVWSRTFPATPAQVRDARRFLVTILDGHQRADDALLCLSELVTNAVVHSRSCQPGGSFTVRAHLDSRHLRVEVCDQGGPWHTPTGANADEQKGRGLLIVSQLATRWGCEGHSQTGWNVWFEIETRPSGPDTRRSQDPVGDDAGTRLRTLRLRRLARDPAASPLLLLHQHATFPTPDQPQ